MSMTLNKASKWIKDLRDRYSKQAEEYEAQGALIPMDVLYPYIQSLDLALAALRGPTREMVERMRGEWEPYGFDKRGRGGIWHCTQCGKSYPVQNTFCPHCGAPMTDEAVDMMLEMWKEALEQ